MEQERNPFAPGAGSPPPELVGRGPILEQARILLGRVKAGRPERSQLLIGLRGVGKTVLLNEMDRMAKASGYHTILVEAHEDKPLGSLLAPHIQRVLFELDRAAGVNDKIKRALGALRGFIGTIRVSATDGAATYSLDIEPTKGVADSGDIEFDLPSLFVALGEAAVQRQAAVAFLIDELQYITARELSALIMAMHKMQQQQLPVVLIGAGLPVLPGLAGDSKSYAERLFGFPEVGALSREDAAQALQEPARAAGVSFAGSALDEIYRLTQGYPYFIQEWGYMAWNLAQSSPITLEVIQSAATEAVARLDRNFFRVRFDRLVPSEKKFLRAIAELGPGPQRTGEIARVHGRTINSLAPVRAKLIKKGMIYSPEHGQIAFTVPLFDEFMKRAIPEFTP